MKIDMVSEHASPLAALGGPDAGGQNVHVGALATALARQGHELTVLTRRDDADLPDRVEFAPGTTVEHVTAGPFRHIPKDRLLPYMSDFAVELSQRWKARPPDIVHAHFWMSGLAALDAARRARHSRRADVPRPRQYQASPPERGRYQSNEPDSHGDPDHAGG